MKRTLLAGLAVGCLAIVAAFPVSAQGLRWGVSAGVLMPMGDYNTIDKPGWIVGAGVMIKAGTGGMRIVLATRYTSVALNPSLNFLPITVGLTFGK